MSGAAPTVAVVGAGLAGLAAAAAARAGGAHVVVLERGDEPGGATAASAGWIWRYRDLATARRCAPHGEPGLQARVVERLDADLDWLADLGARFLRDDTGRAHTVGVRLDPRQVLAALLRHVDETTLLVRREVRDARRGDAGGYELLVRSGRPGALADAPDTWLAADAVVFAGGGYVADLDRIARECGAPPAARRQWVLRATAGGDGSSMDAATRLGAARVPATGESLVRLAPGGDGPPDADGLVAFGELLLDDAILRDDSGRELPRAAHDWSGAQLAWQLARTTGQGRLELERDHLRRRLHSGLAQDVARAAIVAGAPSGRTASGIWLQVRAGLTQTRCGLRVTRDGQLLGLPRRSLLRRHVPAAALPGLFAAGADAACSGMGGTASGLAQALVLGRAAGRAAAAHGSR